MVDTESGTIDDKGVVLQGVRGVAFQDVVRVIGLYEGPVVPMPVTSPTR